MDRRQRKSRDAIFAAFSDLLAKKSYTQITVGEIIEKADVGRATFYAHFETKEYLLKELCRELFCHIFDTKEDNRSHHHIFDCQAPDSVFLHLFQHLGKNDNHILDLLSGQNNDIFLGYFKVGLKDLIESQLDTINPNMCDQLPKSFLVNHIASTFVETVRWWMDNRCRQTPEEITKYFLIAINSPKLI